MSEDHVDDSNSASIVDVAINDLGVYYDKYKDALGNVRKRLWAFVGKVREQALLIDAEEGARERLIAHVQARDDVRESDRFDPDKLDTAALLLIHFLGYDDDTKSLRCQYLKAIKAANADPKSGSTAEEFAAWVGEKGGLRKAGEAWSSPDEAHEDDQEPVSDSADAAETQSASDGGSSSTGNKAKPKGKKRPENNVAFDMALVKKRGSEPIPIKLDLPDDAFVDGYALVAVERSRGTASDKVAYPIKDPRTVSDMIARAAANAKRQADRDWKEASLIHDINMFALKFARAPHVNHNVGGDASVPFLKALKALRKDPLLCQKYGLTESGWYMVVSNENAKDFTSADIKNKDFHEWDPGRFLTGVAKGVLVPYDLNGSYGQRSDRLAKYLADFKALKESRRKKKAGQSESTSSLEPFFVTDEPEAGDAATEAEPVSAQEEASDADVPLTVDADEPKDAAEVARFEHA
jgi:hypothetical protein